MDPETIRRLAKRWLGQSLFQQFPNMASETWWAESGSIRWIGDQKYLQNSLTYVGGQHASLDDTTNPSQNPQETESFDYDLRVE
jgi:hypothetical protein